MLGTPKLTYGLIAVLAIALIAQTIRLSNEQRDHAKTIAGYERDLSTIAKSSAQAAQDILDRYQRQSESLQKEANNAKNQRDKANADHTAAAAVGQRLREKLAISNANRCPATESATTSNGSASTPEAGNMFDYVQRRLDEAADGIAEYADQAHIAGDTCERSYDAIAN